MKMSPSFLLTLTILAGGCVPSCVYYSRPVPEMPYVPRQARPQPPAATAEAPSSVSSPWVVTHPPATQPATGSPVPSSYAPIPEPRPTPPPTAPAARAAEKPTPALPPSSVAPPKPAPAPAPTPGQAPASGVNAQPLDLTRPGVTKPVATEPAPAPAPAASPASKALPTDLKNITNDGPIPVATRVEGDPTRVYNPLDPSKTIRIIDKNGNVFPSGKKLKVRGTNYHFYVP